ncbi:MAG: ferrous iron transport protein A [Oscillospiraceae bacterium]|jgi:ferrous iron transport protein A|nr:ferrous iron transport protein A [Oscillospiraceae bacterium]
MRNLAQLSPGETGVIADVGGPMRARLLELGFIDGTAVTCTRRAARGGLSAYLVRGAVIALRRRDAGGVSICR